MFKVDTIGFLAADPQTKKVGNTDITEFRMGARTSRKNQAGEYISNFFTVSAFGATGEYVAKNAKKGTKVYVTGNMADVDYTKKDGTAGHSLTITASAIELMGSNTGTPVSATAAPKRKQATELGKYEAAVEPDPDNLFG